MIESIITPSVEKGTLGVLHLKRYWHKSMAKREGQLSQDAFLDEWNLDITLLSALGLGLEQTVKHVYQEKPDFNAFEQWIRKLNEGTNLEERILEFNQLLRLDNSGNNSNGKSSHVSNEQSNRVGVNESAANFPENKQKDVLDQVDLDHWEANGYVIIREAVPKADCAATIEMIADFLGIRMDDTDSWYHPHPARQGIMVQLFQHPLLEKNRRSPRIRGAFEQLWGRRDCWCNTDRVSFNPPENAQWKFPGPRLHWDVSLQLPIPFGLQGLLYLSDTTADQGAFTLVPGFHKKIDAWINQLPPDMDPRKEDLYQLGATPIAANAGDFIIWHQALPHGSSPNTSTKPRVVQYINYLPVDAGINEKWK